MSRGWLWLLAAAFPLLALAVALLRCRHRHEVAARQPDGAMGLACLGCGRLRPHPWASGPRPSASPMTASESARLDALREAQGAEPSPQAVADCLAMLGADYEQEAQ